MMIIVLMFFTTCLGLLVAPLQYVMKLSRKYAAICYYHLTLLLLAFPVSHIILLYRVSLS